MSRFLLQWNRSDCLTSVVVSAFLVGTGFMYLPLFVESLIYTKIVFYIFAGVLLSLSLLVAKTDMSMRVSPLIVMSSLLLIYNAIYSIKGQSLMTACLLVTIALLFALYNLSFSLKSATLVIEVSAVVMLLICILQFANILRSNSMLPITSTFDNPSGVSIFLTLCFPFVMSKFLEHYTTKELILLLFMFVVVCLMSSRSGFISLMISGLFILYPYMRWNFGKPQLLVLISFGLCVVFLLLWLKGDSTLGRYLIYRQSLLLGIDRFFFGYGAHGFTAHYMDIQADYFRNHPGSLFSDLADETMHPLNEYIALFIYNGMFGLAFLMMIVWQLRKSWNPQCRVYYGCLIAVCTQSFFTYTLHYPFVWFFVVLCLSQIAKVSSKAIRFSWPYRGVLLLACVFSVIVTVKDVWFEYHWHEVMKDGGSNPSDYQQLAQQWNGNPFFLYNYAAVLHRNFQHAQSNQLLEEYQKYVNDYQSQVMMADNYYALANFHGAYKHYELASLMCPVRFLPLRGMLRTRQKQKVQSEASLIAQTIINKKPKIKSYTVSVIKAEAQNYLEYEKKNNTY